MIKVNIKINNNVIDNIIVKGHAKYNDYGKDIVCASVSSIITTTVNGILNINDKSLKFLEEDGYVNIKLLIHDNVTDKLIKNMIDLLKSLENDYKNNIKIIEEVSICHN